MSLVVEWRHFSSGIVYDITDRINLTDGAFSVTENAEELTVGASTLVIDDPDGDFDIPGHSYIRVTETDCPDEHVIWAGFVTIRHVKRATGFLTGAQRTWTGNLDDVNTVIARRILSEDNDADRPEETDVERIQWLFDEGFLGVLDTYFSSANPVAMSAANCVGMGVYDVVNDCMLQSGKNSFQQDISDGLGGYINFTYYDFASSSALTSDLRISNYISDITAEVGAPSPSGAEQTWYASLDTDMERDPTRVYWKVRGQYDGGTVTRTRPATAVEFAARETTASWPLVKTATAANARADRYLLDISTEEDVITTTIWVHPDHVNDARAGRRIQARFSHLPGYEDWVWMRILNRTVTFETPEVYRIQYTLSATPAFPHSCALQVPGLVNTLYEVGPNSGGPDGISSISVTTIPAPSSFPAVVISGFGGGTGYTGSGDATLSGAFSSLWTDYPTSPLVSVGGYQALGSGAPGAFDVSFGRVDGYCVISIYLLTAATAPVQTAVQDLTGGTATFGATPTVGNILIAYAFDSLNTGGPGRDMTGDGWTLVKMEDGPLHLGFPTGGIQSLALSAWARCVAEGDTDTYDVGGGAFAHWTFLSEWELT